MPAVTGLIPYGKLVIARNMDDLRVELEFRGVAPADVPDAITKRKELLKAFETQRLIAAGVSAAVAEAKKEFMMQSAAPFKLTAD